MGNKYFNVKVWSTTLIQSAAVTLGYFITRDNVSYVPYAVATHVIGLANDTSGIGTASHEYIKHNGLDLSH